METIGKRSVGPAVAAWLIAAGSAWADISVRSSVCDLERFPVSGSASFDLKLELPERPWEATLPGTKSFNERHDFCRPAVWNYLAAQEGGAEAFNRLPTGAEQKARLARLASEYEEVYAAAARIRSRVDEALAAAEEFERPDTPGPRRLELLGELISYTGEPLAEFPGLDEPGRPAIGGTLFLQEGGRRGRSLNQLFQDLAELPLLRRNLAEPGVMSSDLFAQPQMRALWSDPDRGALARVEPELGRRLQNGFYEARKLLNRINARIRPRSVEDLARDLRRATPPRKPGSDAPGTRPLDEALETHARALSPR